MFKIIKFLKDIKEGFEGLMESIERNLENEKHFNEESITKSLSFYCLNDDGDY